MVGDVTVIQCTANKKPAAFARKMQSLLMARMDGLPLITVSHAPMAFGENLCVGRQDMSVHNLWRQFQLGAMKATTRWVCNAEDDTVYPQEYFAYAPQGDDAFYVPDPTYFLFAHKNHIHCFARNRRNDGNAFVVNRKFIIDRIDHLLDGYPMWAPHERPVHLFAGCAVETFPVTVPVLEIRNDGDLYRRCKHDSRHRTAELAPFGYAHDAIKRFT